MQSIECPDKTYSLVESSYYSGRLTAKIIETADPPPPEVPHADLHEGEFDMSYDDFRLNLSKDAPGHTDLWWNQEDSIQGEEFIRFNDKGREEFHPRGDVSPLFSSLIFLFGRPMSYLLTVSDAGFALSFRSDVTPDGSGSKWLAVQRLVHSETGEILTSGNSPVICLTNHVDRKYYVKLGDTIPTAYPDEGEKSVWQVIVRESDVTEPTRWFEVTHFADYSNGFWNNQKQESTHETSAGIVTFPDGINTPRHLYHNWCLDLIGFISGNYLTDGTSFPLTMYETRDAMGVATEYEYNFKGQRASIGQHEGRRLIVMTSGPFTSKELTAKFEGPISNGETIDYNNITIRYSASSSNCIFTLMFDNLEVYTGSSLEFTIKNVSDGYHSFSLQAVDLNDKVSDIVVLEFEVLLFDPRRLVFQGTVFNRIDNTPIPGSINSKVTLFNSYLSLAFDIDGSGAYQCDSPYIKAGAYNLLPFAPGYTAFETQVTGSLDSVVQKDLYMTPDPDGYTITLLWDDPTYDLELHVFVPPTDRAVNHIYYNNIGSLTSPPRTAFIVGHSDGYLRDVVTIARDEQGNYAHVGFYNVWVWSKSLVAPVFPESARVEIVGPLGHRKVIGVSNIGSKRAWYVCKMEQLHFTMNIIPMFIYGDSANGYRS